MSTNSELNNSDLLLNANIDIAHNAVDILADRQVSDIVLLDLTELSAFADYFVIGTVDNIRQARAVIDSIQKNLQINGTRIRPEGDPESGWVLMDTQDGLIIHLFSLDTRYHYDLEGLWSHGKEIVRVQ
ncbi:MAG: ribosome silencing factor [Chloroflexi bacterium]|nr:ribosome silencing factor [Chloroflexota bacterium]HCU80447.1 ribosome silencing factor [Chloroflexota bacterium]|tara:strand:- start:2758 stop:3144 length:387 start_codon:yes stop_codon:yes gene_type:complete